MTTDLGSSVSVSLEDAINTPQPVEHVPIEDLSVEVRQRWLVEVDVAELIASKNLKVLARSEALQLKLAAEYRDHKSKRDKETMDPQVVLHWTNLVFVTANKITHLEKFHETIEQGLFLDSGLAYKQRIIARALTKAMCQISGLSVYEQIRQRLDLPNRDLSIVLDVNKSNTWRVLPAPLPYGPTIDDRSNPVEHYVLWSCHNLLNDAAWLASEIVEVHKNGVAGFVGFEESYGEPPFDNGKRGFSGHPGVRPVENLISSRFDPKLHRVIWYINPVERRTVPALPHCHLWVCRKQETARCPDL